MSTMAKVCSDSNRWVLVEWEGYHVRRLLERLLYISELDHDIHPDLKKRNAC